MANIRKAPAGEREGLPKSITLPGGDASELSFQRANFQVLACRHLRQSTTVIGAAAFAELALAMHYAGMVGR